MLPFMQTRNQNWTYDFAHQVYNTDLTMKLKGVVSDKLYQLLV